MFELILRGSFPELHETKKRTTSFYSSYVATYLEKDLPGLLDVRNKARFLDFLFLLASRTGQLFNATSLANDIGVSVPTIIEWVNVLEASNIILRLRAWSQNATVQVTKSPKIYWTDTGLAAYLAKNHRLEDLEGGMMRGGLYENFVILEIYKNLLNAGNPFSLSFYRDKAGRKVDLIVEKEGIITPIEIKSASTFSPDFVKGLKFFKSQNNEARDGLVLFNGEPTISRYQDIELKNPFKEDVFSSFSLTLQG